MNLYKTTEIIYCLMLPVLIYGSICPSKVGSDPSDVNGRLKNLVSSHKEFEFHDTVNHYVYKWTICQANSDEDIAILQSGGKMTQPASLGSYNKATIVGGTDWFMITYPDGQKYGSHCSKQERKSSVMVTCDPDATTGSFHLIEEFRDKNDTVQVDCYYLFELNNKAACTVIPVDNSLSPGSILLIVFLIVTGVYLILGFLYQRFVAGAKGMEQIPNYDFWTTFGGLQADGCNFLCRCKKSRRTPTYKPVEDALSDDLHTDPDDDNLLPAV